MGELTLLDAMIFQEVIARNNSKIPTLASSLAKKPSKTSFANAWEQILVIDYQPIFAIAYKLIMAIPSSPNVEDALTILANEAQRIASSRALLRHDLMGRIYHLLLMRDIAKYHATYYTSVPAAYILARFALNAPNDNWKVHWDETASIADFRVADLACGSGTLLSAAYTAVLDKHVTEAARQDKDASPQELHRVLLEDVFTGFDVLSFAAHLTAVTLALHNPKSLFNTTGIYALHLTAIGDKPRLGSVDLLESSTLTPSFSFKGEQSFITDVSLAPQKKGISSDEQETVTVDNKDLIIMNPPFTRSMGGNLLFGSLPKKERKVLQLHLQRLLKTKNMTGIGQAGLGAVFFVVSNKQLNKGGRLAFVIPRSIISGMSWRKIRELLVNDYHVELIVVSHQAPGNWNFSENTSLSEALVVARQKTKEEDEPSVRTTIANIWHKPANEMEAIIVAEKLVELNKTLRGHISTYDVIEGVNTSHQSLYLGEMKVGEAYSVTPDALADALDTWGQLMPFAQSALNRVTYQYINTSQMRIPGQSGLLHFPTQPLSNLADQIGSDRPHRMKEFRKVKHNTIYPALWGHESDTIKTITQKPNYWMEINPGKTQRAETLWERRGRLMVAERIRLNTMRLMCTKLIEPGLACEWWPVTLAATKKSSAEEHERIQSLWLNSTFGLLSWLALREDTEGPWVGLKSESVRALPLLNITKCSDKQIASLLKLFGEFAGLETPPFPIQFEEAAKKQGWRYELDKKLVEVITGETKDLTPLYEMLAREPIICLKPLA